MLPDLQKLVTQSEVINLSQPMKQGMPLFPAHVPFSFSLNIRHTDMQLPEGLGMANDVILGCTHSGTHLDAVGHFARNGCIHGGIDVKETVTGNGGLLKGGIEETAPIVRRGVLLDVAAYKDTDALPAGYTITATDLENTAKAQGVELHQGDIALVRTGWGKYWGAPGKYSDLGAGVPGPGLDGAQWLVRKGAFMTGTDNLTYEVFAGGHGGDVHGFLLADQGVQIIENMDLEALANRRLYSFLFVAAPLRIVGATASPITPIAIC